METDNNNNNTATEQEVYSLEVQEKFKNIPFDATQPSYCYDAPNTDGGISSKVIMHCCHPLENKAMDTFSVPVGQIRGIQFNNYASLKIPLSNESLENFRQFANNKDDVHHFVDVVFQGAEDIEYMAKLLAQLKEIGTKIADEEASKGKQKEEKPLEPPATTLDANRFEELNGKEEIPVFPAWDPKGEVINAALKNAKGDDDIQQCIKDEILKQTGASNAVSEALKIDLWTDFLTPDTHWKQDNESDPTIPIHVHCVDL